MKLQRRIHSALSVPILVLVLAASLLSGCKSKQEVAMQQANQQAAATGQAQQIVTVDKAGTTTTITVQPPAKGQTIQAATTVVTPASSGSPIPMASGPTVSAVPLPPVPVNVTIQAGTSLTIRIDQHLGAKSSRSGDTFSGEIVDPVLATDNSTLIPKGALVAGVVDFSHRRGHFKGASLLQLRLTSLTFNGTQYPLNTNDLSRGKRGKGRRTAGFISGGAGLGMLIGGVASGGTGLVIGGLVGGGAGTAVAGLTGNRDIEIPAESVVRFKLADDLVVQQP